MSDFEWQTEDAFDWEESPTDTAASTSSRWPKWIQALPFVLIAMAILLVVVWRAAQQQVVAATAEAAADARASAELFVQSAENGDLELIERLLSGRDPSWTDAIVAALDAGGLFDRSAFGLSLDDGPTVIGEPVMSLDLNSAEITTTVTYKSADAPITLQQTNVYRKGLTYWLLAPPDELFWGETVTKDGNSRIELVYPNRDQDIIREQLLPDLSDDLDAMLATMAELQPVAAPLKLRFQTDPSRLTAARFSVLPGNQLQIDVATPSIVGIPLDDAGYQALRSGYAAQIIALFDAQIGPPLINDAPPAQPPIPYPDAEIALRCGPQNTDLTAAHNGNTSVVYRSRLTTGEWVKELDLLGTHQLRELPGQGGYALVDRQNDVSTLLVINQRMVPLPQGYRVDGLYQSDPNRLQLSRVDLATMTPSVSVGVLDLTQLDSEDATMVPLPLDGLVAWSADGQHGLFYNQFAQSGSEVRVIGQDGIARASLTRDVDSLPFWVSNALIGWREDAQTYRLYDFGAGTTREWLSLTDLRNVLPMSDQLLDPSLHIFPAPSLRHPHQMILQVNEGAVARHLLIYDFTKDQLEYVGELAFTSFVDVSATGSYIVATRDMPNSDSDDGLRVIAYHQASGAFDIYPITSRARVHAPVNNDDWLMIVDAGTLRLVAPAYNFEQSLVLPNEGCDSAVWVVD